MPTAVTATWSTTVPELSLAVAATAGDSRDLLRHDPGGLTVVAVGLGLDPVVDRHAPLGGGTYTIRVWTGASSTDETFTVAADVTWGGVFVVSSATAHACLVWDPSRRRQMGRRRYVRDGYPGRPWPREVVDGAAMSDVLSVSGDLFRTPTGGETAVAAWEAVQADAGGLWYRDPLGANWPASVSLLDQSTSDWYSDALSFTVIRLG